MKVYISDNCSSDDTQEKINKLIKNDSRFRYTRNDSNLGMMGNFLRVMNLAQGQYLWLFGDDDEFHDSKSLSKIIRIIRRHGPAYLTLQPTAYSQESESLVFRSVKDYISHFAGKTHMHCWPALGSQPILSDVLHLMLGLPKTGLQHSICICTVS